MNSEYIFVYGTLRRDIKSEMYHLLARYAEFVDEATYQGKLYKIDYYPGVIPSNNHKDHVYGEVYKLLNPEIVLPRLDEYEECAPTFPEPTEYVRKKEKVTLKSGQIIWVWIYIYNRSTENFQRIASGDFSKK
jgi:gamma-glutamylcyclotransferase (GGCT)/AIG2-like uncharacterized protein YtfP